LAGQSLDPGNDAARPFGLQKEGARASVQQVARERLGVVGGDGHYFGVGTAAADLARHLESTDERKRGVDDGNIGNGFGWPGQPPTFRPCGMTKRRGRA
jgi:hypothetical protein